MPIILGRVILEPRITRATTLKHNDHVLLKSDTKLSARIAAARQRFEREARPFLDREAPTKGPFAGHGPKGYRRSDEPIQEYVCERSVRNRSRQEAEG